MNDLTQDDDTNLIEDGDEQDLVIDPRIKSHIPPLRPDEYSALEANIREFGCLTPLVVWGDVLLDGHNRLEICNKYDIPYELQPIDLPDFDAALAWVEDNQLGRRNLTKEQFDYFIGRLYARRKANQAKRFTDAPSFVESIFEQAEAAEERKKAGQKVPSARPIEEDIAKQHGIVGRTVRRHAQFAENVDKIAEAVGDQARTTILAGGPDIIKQDVEVAASAIEGGISFPNTKAALAWAREKRKEARAERRARKAARNPEVQEEMTEAMKAREWMKGIKEWWQEAPTGALQQKFLRWAEANVYA